MFLLLVNLNSPFKIIRAWERKGKFNDEVITQVKQMAVPRVAVPRVAASKY